jgi:hypothetical protein
MAAPDKALTNAQIKTVRDYCFTVPEAAALIAAGDVPGLRTFLNSSFGTLGWVPSADLQTLTEAPSYANYSAADQGQRDSWSLFTRALNKDMAKASIRKWVEDCWGAAVSGSNAEKVLLAGCDDVTQAQHAIGGVDEVTGAVLALDRKYWGSVTSTDTTSIIFKANGTIWTSGL